MKKGVTLLEVIVSIVILATMMLGLVNIFLSSKRYLLHARARMTSGELDRAFVDTLHMDVRQDTWNDLYNNSLTAPRNYTGASQIINNINYTPHYNITNVTGASLRRVLVNITWNEPTQ